MEEMRVWPCSAGTYVHRAWSNETTVPREATLGDGIGSLGDTVSPPPTHLPPLSPFSTHLQVLLAP